MRRRLEPSEPSNTRAEEQLARDIQSLVSEGRVGRARALLAQLTPEQRQSAALSGWVRALAPPKVRAVPATSTRSVDKDAAWIRAEGARYAGQWVALRDGVLVGHNVQELALYRELQARGELNGVLFVCLKGP